MLTFHKAKHRNSPKGVTHDFGQKNCKKLYLIFRKIRLKKECLQVLNKKETFLDHKMGSFHKVKNRNFQKGLAHDFCQKFKIFHCLFLDFKKN